VVGQSVFDDVARPDAEDHIRFQMRFPNQQIAHHVGAYDLFVHGVGLDVLAIELDTRPRRPEPLECLHQAPRSGRRGDLGRGEVPDRGSAQFTVKVSLSEVA